LEPIEFVDRLDRDARLSGDLAEGRYLVAANDEQACRRLDDRSLGGLGGDCPAIVRTRHMLPVVRSSF
jgi:hypothetical protein